MRLKHFRIRNFRRLKDVRISTETETTIFVGANNSGKTSAAEIFQYFFKDRVKFSLYDLCAQCWGDLNTIGKAVVKSEEPKHAFPSISLDLWFDLDGPDVHRVYDLLPGLNWVGQAIGIRIEFGVTDAKVTIEEFKKAYDKAQETLEKAKKSGKGKKESPSYKVWPANLTDFLERQLRQHYEVRYYVLDRSQFDDELNEVNNYQPQRLGTTQGLNTGRTSIARLFKVDFLQAQRHIAERDGYGGDGDGGDRSGDLSKRFRSFYERNLEQRGDDYEALGTLANSERELNAHLASVFSPTLKSLNTLGYLADPRVTVRATLDASVVAGGNTRVHYELTGAANPDDNCLLPDSYNGLGFKNLMYMVLELLDGQAAWRAEPVDRPLIHLVIIEEPEAHLHAQLQQVFIRNIYDILQEGEGANSPFTTQLLVTTHSPHVIYEHGFSGIRYFRRSLHGSVSQESTVLDLGRFKKLPAATKHAAFLERYMKLTHCDLFFADAAILVEGNVERLLLPTMIENAAPELQSAYLTILEVGGAYAHIFKEMVEFLGVPTLVVTDLDSISAGSRPNMDEEDSDKSESSPRGTSCPVHEPNSETSNETLRSWIPKKPTIKELLSANDGECTLTFKSGVKSSVYVTYQRHATVTWRGITGQDEPVTAERAGRTLEEQFGLENLQWVQAIERKNLLLRVTTKTGPNTLEALAQRLFDRVNSSNFKKTDFAISLLAEDPTHWRVPQYITKGLKWLAKELKLPLPQKDAPTNAEGTKK